MIKKAKLIIIITVITVIKFIFPKTVIAHCPLCVAGAGAGLGISRWLGIDDSITGIWMAAFLGATSLWIANSTKRKFLPFQELWIYLGVFIATLASFYQFKLINPHAGLIMGTPKLTFGIILGGVVFYLMDLVNHLLKNKNGKVLFPYQGVIFSLVSMLILSIGMFVFINYYI